MSSDNHWKKNIKLNVRIRVGLRDWFLKTVYNRVQQIRRNKGLASRDLFKHILIQTNYTCTRKCTFCHYGLDNPPANVNMDEKLFYSIIEQLADLKYKGRVGLFEMNEPLTDKRFMTFLKYAREKLPKAWIFISSNGDLLNIKNTHKLFNAGLNYIWLSSYDKKALDRNLKLIRNLDEKLKDRLSHIDRTYQAEWTSRGGNVEKYRKKTIFDSCDMVYRVMYIKPSGKVYSCYNDFFDKNEMGDLNKDSLKGVWFNQRFICLRENLDKGNRDFSDLCSRCDYKGYGNLPKVSFRWKLKSLIK